MIRYIIVNQVAMLAVSKMWKNIDEIETVIGKHQWVFDRNDLSLGDILKGEANVALNEVALKLARALPLACTFPLMIEKLDDWLVERGPNAAVHAVWAREARTVIKRYNLLMEQFLTAIEPFGASDEARKLYTACVPLSPPPAAYEHFDREIRSKFTHVYDA
jgi:hypothetical protein